MPCLLHPDETTDDLVRALRDARDYGRVSVAVRAHACPRSTAVECANAITTAMGYVPCAWREVGRDVAHLTVASCLQFDLAYHEPIRTLAEATMLTERFLSRFDPNARFFTNGDPVDASDRYGSRGWMPITAATFDAGVIAISADHVGIFWVEDED